MKKLRVILFFLGCTTFTLPLQAQDDLDELLKGSLADANYLLEGYVAPVMKGLGSGLNQGWYNSAKTHKPFGVDFTITTSLIYVPDADLLYKVDNNALQEVKLTSYDGQPVSPTGSGNVPTIFGPEKTPTYEITASGTTFDGPPGLDLEGTIKLANALPVPMYHLGIGLPKGTDLKVRFSPTLEIDQLKFSLLGFAVMHDVKQYIPGIKALPFDLSAFVGYTNMKVEQGIEATTGQNQKAVVAFNSTNIQAIISKKISVLTLYGAVGYNFAKSSLDMKGTYDLDDDGTVDATDPVNLDFSTSGPRITGGLRLKFAVFTLHGDYTLAKYNSLSAGFGIYVR
ncbi:MAG: DUF6588 family protein [Cytophagales bacterium]|nr:DUF6588 family protein [Cytophagales bacterium]